MALTDNLVAYYNLDGNSNDSVGSNNGTDTDITYSEGNGKIVQGAGFNGSSSMIQPPSGSIRPTGSFTINAWIKTSVTGTGKLVYQTYSQLSPAVSGFQFNITTGNVVSLSSGKNSGYVSGVDYKNVTGVTHVCTGNWTMVTGEYNGSTLEVFVNGISDGSVPWTNAPVYQADSKPTLGTNNYQQALFTEYFNGAIDEVGIWSRALSPTEITQLYNGGVGLTYPFIATNNASFLFNIL